MPKFEAIYIKYRRLMYKIAFELLGNVQEAEDAVQDAFVRICDNIEKIGDPDCPQTRSYCVIITRNICFNKLRHSTPLEIDDQIPSADNVEEEFFSGIRVEAFERALKKLNTNYRDIMYLTVYEELSLHRAAELLGITYENAKSRVKRARKKLAEILKEDGYYEK